VSEALDGIANVELSLAQLSLYLSELLEVSSREKILDSQQDDPQSSSLARCSWGHAQTSASLPLIEQRHRSSSVPRVWQVRRNLGAAQAFQGATGVTQAALETDSGCSAERNRTRTLAVGGHAVPPAPS
jgi:hypothetical protein